MTYTISPAVDQRALRVDGMNTLYEHPDFPGMLLKSVASIEEALGCGGVLLTSVATNTTGIGDGRKRLLMPANRFRQWIADGVWAHLPIRPDSIDASGSFEQKAARRARMAIAVGRAAELRSVLLPNETSGAYKPSVGNMIVGHASYVYVDPHLAPVVAGESEWRVMGCVMTATDGVVHNIVDPSHATRSGSGYFEGGHVYTMGRTFNRGFLSVNVPLVAFGYMWSKVLELGLVGVDSGLRPYYEKHRDALMTELTASGKVDSPWGVRALSVLQDDGTWKRGIANASVNHADYGIGDQFGLLPDTGFADSTNYATKFVPKGVGMHLYFGQQAGLPDPTKLYISPYVNDSRMVVDFPRVLKTAGQPDTSVMEPGNYIARPPAIRYAGHGFDGLYCEAESVDGRVAQIDLVVEAIRRMHQAAAYNGESMGLVEGDELEIMERMFSVWRMENSALASEMEAQTDMSMSSTFFNPNIGRVCAPWGPMMDTLATYTAELSRRVKQEIES